MTSNSWLMANKLNCNNVGRRLVEYHMMGSYGGNLDLMSIKRIIDGALNEIQRLQNENDNLKIENSKKVQELKELKDTIKMITGELDDIKNAIKG